MRRSSKLPERQDKGRQLGPRTLSHLRTKCLWLLPSGPDQVHTVLPQKVSFFNTATQSSTRFGSPLKTASPPHEGDFGYRTPLTSRLHGCFFTGTLYSLDRLCGRPVALGGEGGIRTREAGITHLHAFQACSFGHSDTSPKIQRSRSRETFIRPRLHGARKPPA